MYWSIEKSHTWLIALVLGTYSWPDATLRHTFVKKCHWASWYYHLSFKQACCCTGCMAVFPTSWGSSVSSSMLTTVPVRSPPAPFVKSDVKAHLSQLSVCGQTSQPFCVRKSSPATCYTFFFSLSLECPLQLYTQLALSVDTVVLAYTSAGLYNRPENKSYFHEGYNVQFLLNLL